MKAKFNLVNENDFHCGKQITVNDNCYIYTAVLPNEVIVEDDGTKTNETVVCDIEFKESLYDYIHSRKYKATYSVADKNLIIKVILERITNNQLYVFDRLTTYIGKDFFVFYRIESPNLINVFVKQLTENMYIEGILP